MAKMAVGVHRRTTIAKRNAQVKTRPAQQRLMRSLSARLRVKETEDAVINTAVVPRGTIFHKSCLTLTGTLLGCVLQRVHRRAVLSAYP